MNSSAVSTRTIYTIAIIGFIYSLHLALPIYSNSSFLALFANTRTVGFIYMAGSAMAILGFLIAPNIIRRFGNYATIVGLICVEIVLLYILSTSYSAHMIAGAFILQAAVVSLVGLSLDIFLEAYTDEAHIGTIRGFYSATLNASWLIAPLIGSMLIGAANNYRNTYIAALAMLLPLLYLIYRNFSQFKNPEYIHLSPWHLLQHIYSNKNWVKLFMGNIILQVFYAWMVVYSPIYLHKTIGFGWTDIGIILTVMLIPFPLIQYPLGRLADTKYGEKEIMAIGFVIMGVSTMLLAFISIPHVALWAFALLMTRIGAASIEIMMETYFFKTVPTKDTAMLGSFRITRPLAYFIAPLIMGASLLFTTDQYVFIVIGAIVLLGLIPTLTIKDTN